jgi:hypothetical protein
MVPSDRKKLQTLPEITQAPQASTMMYAAVGPSDLGNTLKMKGSNIRSTSTDGGLDINSLSVVKKSAAALTRRNNTLSLVFAGKRDGSGRFLSESSENPARFWISSGVSKTSEMVYTSSQNSVGCCLNINQYMLR